MIRFIDLRECDVGYNFALFDTVANEFLEFQGEQAWDHWSRLEYVVTQEFAQWHSEQNIEEFLEKIRAKLPDWARP